MYKLCNGTNPNGDIVLKAIYRSTDNAFIPINPANTDYANFKKEILADEAQLQDADGNVMTDAKAYVASLP